MDKALLERFVFTLVTWPERPASLFFSSQSPSSLSRWCWYEEGASTPADKDGHDLVVFTVTYLWFMPKSSSELLNFFRCQLTEVWSEVEGRNPLTPVWQSATWGSVRWDASHMEVWAYL